MRRFFTMALAMGAVFAMALATAGPAAAARHHRWQSHGLKGVNAWGNWHGGHYHGHKTRVLLAHIKDTRGDGHLAGLKVLFTRKGHQNDARKLWNPYGAHTTARVKIQSYNKGHLYIRECKGHNKKKFHITHCGKWRKYT